MHWQSLTTHRFVTGAKDALCTCWDKDQEGTGVNASRKQREWVTSQRFCPLAQLCATRLWLGAPRAGRLHAESVATGIH